MDSIADPLSPGVIRVAMESRCEITAGFFCIELVRREAAFDQLRQLEIVRIGLGTRGTGYAFSDVLMSC